MSYFKTGVIHSLLLSVFPIIHLYSINFIEVKISDVILPLFISILATSIFLIITKLVLKDWVKSGFIISWLLILTFSYGHFYGWLNAESLEEIARHSILLPLFFLLFIIGTILVVKTKKNLDKLKTIINVIALTMIVITLPNFVYGSFSATETYEEKPIEILQINYELEKIKVLDSIEKPDIYYILLDGYGGTKRMKQDLNFDNYEFLSELTGRGFFAPDQSYSNYPITGWQMASIFSMNYVPMKEKEQSDMEYQSMISDILYQNEVMRNLHELNYKIFQYQPNGFVTQSYAFVDQEFCNNEVSKISKFGKMLLRTSIFNYFNYLMEIDNKRNSILCGFLEISSLKENDNKPIFVYLHLALPHQPYVFDSEGNHVLGGKTQIEENSFVDKELYVGSIEFSNKKTLEIIDKILKNNKNSIIIIQSDHGYDFGINFQNPSEKHLKQRFSNINAIYLPNKENIFYEGVTPVNTFRIIFNEYFHMPYDILEDKMYYHPYEVTLRYKDVNFQDVTEIIVN